MAELIKINAYPVKNVLSQLLQDKTTGKNIIFATDNYNIYGQGYSDTDEITESTLLGSGSPDIQPRVMKTQAEQSERTRKKAEVFTPTRIVKQMRDYYEDSQQKEADNWKKFVELRVLEITCGEAPFLVTRYDTTTGDLLPLTERVGMLDRKLQIVNRHTADEKEWLKWAIRAYESTYGYEFQGDNLLIARINLLHTFCDYLTARFKRSATDSELKKIATILAWNVWQMDGLKDDDYKIYDWRCKKTLLLNCIKKEEARMRFDFVIGNPPYQKDRRGESTTALPIYHKFMDAAYAIGTVVELITPARFLFNAGRTPKKWNEQMLSDKHLKVLYYEQDGSKIFPNTDIKGGIAITYRDSAATYAPIGRFTIYPELNTILSKMCPLSDEDNLSSIGFVSTKFNISALVSDYPKYAGHERRMSSNVLSFDFFHSSKEADSDVMIYGVIGGKRTKKYISNKYVDMSDWHINKFKLIMPKADGIGAFGDILTKPEILEANSGFTHTFLGMGAFDTKTEAESALKYIKTKFARAVLSVLKVTQDMNADKWRLVPLQDFTPGSDIDWSQPIPEIDKQLYTKYGLTQEEINFIETHVKAME